MENSKSKLINEIAQELDCGNACYYNPKTDEIIAIPNFSNFMDDEEFQNLFKADLKKVRKNKVDYIKIEVLESSESFKIMQHFVDQMSENPLKSDLESILQRKSPFKISNMPLKLQPLENHGLPLNRRNLNTSLKQSWTQSIEK